MYKLQPNTPYASPRTFETLEEAIRVGNELVRFGSHKSFDVYHLPASHLHARHLPRASHLEYHDPEDARRPGPQPVWLTNEDLRQLHAAGAVIGSSQEITLLGKVMGYPVNQVAPPRREEKYGQRLVAYIEGYGDFPVWTETD